MSDRQQPPQRPTIPIEFAGQWIAWNADRTHIVASGATYAEAYDAAMAAGQSHPVLQKVPDRKVRSIMLGTP